MKSAYDEGYILSLINRCKWTWAKTYVNVPHEYIVRGKCALSDEEFISFVEVQRKYGTPEQWHKYNHPYLYVDGYKYWTMDGPLEDCKALNRQKVFSEFDNLNLPDEDVVPFGCVSTLRFQFGLLWTGNYIYEFGCGAGDSVRGLLLRSNTYIGIDPSRKAIDRFKAKYPDFANRLYVSSFEESVRYWSQGNPFILATFGTASYIMRPYLELLDKSGKGYFIMFYKEGYCPKEYEGTHYFRYSLDDIHKMLPLAELLPYNNYYIASNKKMHQYIVNWLLKWELDHLKDLFVQTPFREDKAPYDNLFCAQMSSIMKETSRNFSEYLPFIDLQNLNVDYEEVCKKYESMLQKTDEALVFSHNNYMYKFDSRHLKTIREYILQRLAYFGQYR